MGLTFRNKKSTKNTSDNNITVNTSTDIMFKIGQDLGEIKSDVKSNVDELKYIKNKLKNHSDRIQQLERKCKVK